MTVSAPDAPPPPPGIDGWACEGQADLLAELPADGPTRPADATEPADPTRCPACHAIGRHSATCHDPWASGDGRVYPLKEAS